MLRTTPAYTDVHNLKQSVITYLLIPLWLFSQSEIGPNLQSIRQFKTRRAKSSNNVSKSMSVFDEQLEIIGYILIVIVGALFIVFLRQWCGTRDPLIKSRATWSHATRYGYNHSNDMGKIRTSLETEVMRLGLMRYPSVPDNKWKRAKLLAQQPDYFQRFPDGGFGHGSLAGDGTPPLNLQPVIFSKRHKRQEQTKEQTKPARVAHRPTIPDITALLSSKPPESQITKSRPSASMNAESVEATPQGKMFLVGKMFGFMKPLPKSNLTEPPAPLLQQSLKIPLKSDDNKLIPNKSNSTESNQDDIKKSRIAIVDEHVSRSQSQSLGILKSKSRSNSVDSKLSEHRYRSHSRLLQPIPGEPERESDSFDSTSSDN